MRKYINKYPNHIKLYEKFENTEDSEYYQYLDSVSPYALEDVMQTYLIDEEAPMSLVKEIENYLNEVLNSILPIYKKSKYGSGAVCIFVKDLRDDLGRYRGGTESNPIIVLNRELHDKWIPNVPKKIAYLSTIIHELVHALVELADINEIEWELPYNEEEFVENVAEAYIKGYSLPPEFEELSNLIGNN